MNNHYVEDYENALFKAATYEYAISKSKQLMEDAEQYAATEEYQEDLARFEKKISKAYRRAVNRKRLRTFLKVSSKILVVILVMLSLTFTSVMTVSAWREGFTRFLVSVSPEYSEIRLGKESGPPAVIPNHAYSKVGIQNMPAYIPDGFEIKTMDLSSGILDIYYEHEDGFFISYTAYSSTYISQIDSENTSDSKLITISGNEGSITCKNGITTIIWSSEEYYYIIVSPLEEKELIQIAESISS